MDKKPFFKSKRFWSAVITAVAPWVPYVGPWIAANPELYAALMAGLFGSVGAVSEKKLKFMPEKTISL